MGHSQRKFLPLTGQFSVELNMLTLGAASFAFLEKCVAGASLGQAASRALEIDQAADLKTSIAQFISFGAFMPIAVPASNQKGDHV